MPPGPMKGTVVETDDLDNDFALILERGEEMPGGIQDAPWGRFVTLDDPDGNGIVIQAPLQASETHITFAAPD